MEKRKKKLACDDSRENWGDYCLNIYRESVKNGTYKKEDVPEFIKKINEKKEKNTSEITQKK